MSAAPLANLVVVDLGRHLPAPLATRLLRDLGARVIKVEEPTQGDPVRTAPPGRGGRSGLATLLLAGQESVALDLKRPGAVAALDELLAGADVLVESFRPGTLARLGLDPAALRTRFPRLVVLSISGWGQDGPHAGRAGHDLTYEAVGGSLAATARVPAVPVADLVGAWSAVTAVLAALLERERSGQGAWIDAALGDAAVHAALVSWGAEADGPKAVGERLALTGALPCYNLYRTADGEALAVACLEPHFWRRLCDAVGRPDLVGLQFDVGPEARARVAALVATRRRAEWEEIARVHDLPVAPVLAPSAVRAHPQVAARGVVASGDDGLARLAFPARFDGERPGAGAAAGLPVLGEHTASVLRGAGSGAMELSRGERRRAGIGRRWSARRLLARWLLR